MFNPLDPSYSIENIPNNSVDRYSMPVWNKIGSLSYQTFLPPPSHKPVHEHAEPADYSEKGLEAARHGVNIATKKFIIAVCACVLAATVTFGMPQLIYYIKEHKTARVATFISGFTLLSISGFIAIHFLLALRDEKLTLARFEHKKAIFEARQHFYVKKNIQGND